MAIGYLDRAARRLAGEPGYQRHARTLERLSGELAEVLGDCWGCVANVNRLHALIHHATSREDGPR